MLFIKSSPVIRNLIVILSVLSLITAPIFASSTFALSQPTFSFVLADSSLDIHSDMTLNLEVPSGLEVPNNLDIDIPAGWRITPGNSLLEDAIVGTGTMSGVRSGNPFSNVPFTIYNRRDTQSHLARWNFVFAGGVVKVDFFIDGDINNGYILDANIGSDITSPMTLNFTMLGSTTGGDVLINPVSDGTYYWKLVLGFPSGTSTTFTYPVAIPGGKNTTTDGTDIALSSGVTVNYDKVSSGGVTTITATTGQPTAEPGLFQVSGGLYYDIDTTADVSCPCKVTLPYDPKATEKPQIYHLEDGVWVDVTTTFDPIAQTVTGVVSSFSYFVAAQPNHIAEWRSPVKAFKNKGEPFELNKNQALPLNLIVRDSTGNVVLPDSLVIELIRVSDNTILLPITLQFNDEGTLLQGKIQFKEISGITTGEYLLRVRIGNTTLAPDVHFTIS